MKAFAKLLSLAFLAVFSTAVFAQPMAPGQKEVQGFRGLPEDQVQQISALLDQNRIALAPQLARIRVLEAQIELELAQPNVDLKAIGSLVDQKALINAAVEKQTLALKVQVRQIVGDSTFFCQGPPMKGPDEEEPMARGSKGP